MEDRRKKEKHHPLCDCPDCMKAHRVDQLMKESLKRVDDIMRQLHEDLKKELEIE